MKRVLMIAAMAMMAGPAMAGPSVVDVETLAPLALPLNPGEARAGAGAEIVITDPAEDAPMGVDEQARLLCETTVIMGSTPGADYRAGVDVRGRPVVPAEGYGAAPVYTLPERIDIPLTIDVLNTVGVTGTPTPALSTNVGTMSILKGGQVLYNGQDMTSDVQAYCDTHPTTRTDETKTTP